MEFRDLRKQYQVLEKQMNSAMIQAVSDGHYIMGKQVLELEEVLADYVGVKHCISCGNGTDALLLALMAWGVQKGDAVFVPDFTFFASAEVVAALGATPIFVDVDMSTYNLDPHKLEVAILETRKRTSLTPKAVVAVDLFGQPADYDRSRNIGAQYGLLLLEDGAQGFGGRIDDRKACSFGDMATTSFFPAKPLGCYGDGGAIFTDHDEWAQILRSLRVHGKGTDKYDNIRIGMNSRLDTIQAAILLVKFEAFNQYELREVNRVAEQYRRLLPDTVIQPMVPEGYVSSWAQYTIQLGNKSERDALQAYLKKQEIPSMVYYPKPMHCQTAFQHIQDGMEYPVTDRLCSTVLSLPMHPYMSEEEIIRVSTAIQSFITR